MQLGTVPANWKELVRSFNLVEEKADERSRFERVKVKAATGKKALQQSFPRQRTVRVRYLLRRLERFMREVSGSDVERPSMARDLYDELNAQMQALYQLGEI